MQVSIHELKSNPTRAIAIIRPGQPVQIISHRKVVAQLVAPDIITAPPVKLADEETNHGLRHGCRASHETMAFAHSGGV